MNWLYEAYVHYLAEIDFLIVYDRFAWYCAYFKSIHIEKLVQMNVFIVMYIVLNKVGVAFCQNIK